MAKFSWLKWNPDKWLSDELVKLLSFPQKGLWIDMLSLMAKSQTPGMLPYVGPDRCAERLALQLGRPAADIRPLLAGILDAEVASLSDDGRYIYSRKMVRDWESYQKAKAIGSLGGNPKLVGLTQGLTGGLSPPVKRPLSSDVLVSDPSAASDSDAGARSAIRPDWSINALDGILRCYPASRQGRPIPAREAIAAALEALSSRADVPDPVEHLRIRTLAYAASPQGKSARGVGAFKWFDEGGYDEDDSAWQRTYDFADNGGASKYSAQAAAERTKKLIARKVPA